MTILAIAILATLTLALRLAPDALRDAALLRALLFRAAFFALSGALLGALAALALPNRPWRRTALAGSAAASIAYFLGLLTLARIYDARIAQQAAAATGQHGTVAIHAPHRPTVTVRSAADSYHITEPVGAIPAAIAQLLACAEDERFYRRVGGLDLEAYARAIAATFRALATGNKSAIQGGSEIAGQVGAALMPELKPVGRNLAAVKTKILKSLVAFRIDDNLAKDDQIRLYLTLAPFGAIDGHEIIGIAAAARAFYNREYADLTPAQTAELLARLKNPIIYYPYRRRTETIEAFDKRLDRHRRRFEAILDIAQRDGVLSAERARIAKAEFLYGLVPYETARDAARVPRLTQVLSELDTIAPDRAHGRLDVYLNADPALETALARATRATIRRIEAGLARHPGDELQADATVLAPDGTIAAEIGLATIPSGQASHIKPEIYALWVASGHSLRDPIPGLRMNGLDALAFSRNEGVKAVTLRLGLPAVVEHLRSQDFFVVGPYLPIALGAGVTASPRTVAGAFMKFGYAHPGQRSIPRWISRVADDSGAIVFQNELALVFAPEVAAEVRKALEKAASSGTGRKALSHLAPQGLAIKTGTAGFFRRGQWLGEGGSWTVAADRTTGLTIAVRLRWKSGRPFQLEGGASAAYIMRDFIAAARVLTREEQQ